MLNEKDKQIIRELQDFLPLVNRPFKVIAARVGLTEEELLERIKVFLEQGIIRRFGAAVRHQDLGFTANAMVVWDIPEDRVDSVGRRLAAFPEVSHCYHRPRQPGWPYSLFTVLHGGSAEECAQIAAEMAAEAGNPQYRLIFSTRELKKSSMKYFV
ncbi:MAG: AsnC family transcriptional regulator [Bacillota bacterium]|jgi:DNA-binding Lrp family transcriptional regulator